MSDIRAVLTDIEGTTSSISFVKDVLFPFAKRNLEVFIAAHRDSPQVRRCLDDARELAGNPGLSDDATVALLRQWIDEDRKATPLKTLQGLIWEQGYARGELQGHMYPDAVEGLRAWHAKGLRLYVYSSGSVAAQKLVFGYTAWGDLTPLFSGYFDTTTGPKVESPSYTRIAREIGLPPEQVLFLSDSVAELNAARSAGMRTACLDRGEAVIPAGHGHPTFHGFATLDPSAF
ncbi:acireductone synthase [Myxococcus sp. RHSTA-1-4]|uniref:acireductone synthase n=1 Tax=Myxococcus sp. RHSTA-1-4 TaxID=2874601 RepID=UPI001CBBD146|nr:acireductone synthase [Myxococcus sp. RHSTA-1-4]MBZ4419285.1 acireductone synthase [Myxococcus sp. RHSTA-1-4]